MKSMKEMEKNVKKLFSRYSSKNENS